MASELAEVVGLDVRLGGVADSQSGLFLNNPRIFARLARGEGRKRAFVVAHPTSNFFNHYLFGAMRRHGETLLAVNTRYAGNDATLLMERCIQDLGAGIRFLREEGYEQIVLIGNSGGGSLAAFYQEQAENLTLGDTPDGRRLDLAPQDLPKADAIALLAAHPGRAQVLTDWLDPSIVDEADMFAADPRLDMYDPRNGPPYGAGWLAEYRAAQVSRNHRITDWALDQLHQLEATAGPDGARDRPFLVFRTGADPRFLDLAIDPSDRALGSVRGSARATNNSVNGIARFSSLRSWLSQWSLRLSRADGPACLSRTAVPVLSVTYSADAVVFPSQLAQWSTAAAGRCTSHTLVGATHHLARQPDLQGELAELLVNWARRLN